MLAYWYGHNDMHDGCKLSIVHTEKLLFLFYNNVSCLVIQFLLSFPLHAVDALAQCYSCEDVSH